MFPVTTTKIDFPDLLIDHFRIIIDANKTYEYNVTGKKNRRVNVASNSNKFLINLQQIRWLTYEILQDLSSLRKS